MGAELQQLLAAAGAALAAEVGAGVEAKLVAEARSELGVGAGLGRIVVLCCRSSVSYQIR